MLIESLRPRFSKWIPYYPSSLRKHISTPSSLIIQIAEKSPTQKRRVGSGSAKIRRILTGKLAFCIDMRYNKVKRTKLAAAAQESYLPSGLKCGSLSAAHNDIASHRTTHYTSFSASFQEVGNAFCSPCIVWKPCRRRILSPLSSIHPGRLRRTLQSPQQS